MEFRDSFIPSCPISYRTREFSSEIFVFRHHIRNFLIGMCSTLSSAKPSQKALSLSSPPSSLHLPPIPQPLTSSTPQQPPSPYTHHLSSASPKPPNPSSSIPSFSLPSQSIPFYPREDLSPHTPNLPLPRPELPRPNHDKTRLGIFPIRINPSASHENGDFGGGEGGEGDLAC